MKTRVIAILAILALWALLLWVGLDLSAGVQARHIPGAPSIEQIEYYVGIPVVACLLGLTGAALSLKRKSPVTPVIGLLLLVALLPYIIPYGGGM